MSGAVLLDTCAAIWLVQDGRLAAPARQAIVEAAREAAVFVSPITAWEIGFLAHPAKGPSRVHFLPDPKTWFAALLTRPGIRLAAFTPDIAIDAATLPGDLHRDPADRLIIATARALNVALVTRDERILAYAASGYVRAVGC